MTRLTSKYYPKPEMERKVARLNIITYRLYLLKRDELMNVRKDESGSDKRGRPKN